MPSFISDVASAFNMGTMTNKIERNVNGIVGIIGVVGSVALAIFGAPLVLAAATGVIFSGLLLSAILESKGLAYTSYIALTGAALALAILFPPPIVFQPVFQPTTVWVY